MNQPDLFDEQESERLKREGMAGSARTRKAALDLARAVAKRIALRTDGTCHADQVGEILKSEYDIDSLGPAAGSIFKGTDWKFSGDFVKSSRTTNHSRLLRIWRLC